MQYLPGGRVSNAPQRTDSDAAEWPGSRAPGPMTYFSRSREFMWRL